MLASEGRAPPCNGIESHIARIPETNTSSWWWCCCCGGGDGIKAAACPVVPALVKVATGSAAPTPRGASGSAVWRWPSAAARRTAHREKKGFCVKKGLFSSRNRHGNVMNNGFTLFFPTPFFRCRSPPCHACATRLVGLNDSIISILSFRGRRQFSPWTAPTPPPSCAACGAESPSAARIFGILDVCRTDRVVSRQQPVKLRLILSLGAER